MVNNIVPIMLCGGQGKRLYPLSTEFVPKQFLKLYGCFTLFQYTILRVMSNLFSKSIIVSNLRYKSLIEKQLAEIDYESCLSIFETNIQNTAISITLAAICLNHYDSDAIMLILPTDHYIGKLDNLLSIFLDAASHIINNPEEILLFGIIPYFAETNYGYMKCKSRANIEYSDYYYKYITCINNIYKEKKPLTVDDFKEKPNLSTIQQYIESGEYYWNSGIYMAKVSTIIESIKFLAQDIYYLCENAIKLSYQKNKYDDAQCDILYPTFENNFGSVINISFDKAITEKCQNLKMFPINTDWYDLGSFNAMKEFYYAVKQPIM